jgi:hypothetical protein
VRSLRGRLERLLKARGSSGPPRPAWEVVAVQGEGDGQTRTVLCRGPPAPGVSAPAEVVVKVLRGAGMDEV